MHWSTEQSPSTSIDRRQFGGHQPGVERVPRSPRCGRRLPAPAHRGEPGPPRPRRSSSAADRRACTRLHSQRREHHRVGADRSGRETLGPRHGAGRGVERVAEAGRSSHSSSSSVASARPPAGALDGDLAARSPLQHHHRQPGFLLELRVGQVIVAAEGRRIHLPEHAPARVLGQLLERFEPQGRDSR